MDASQLVNFYQRDGRDGIVRYSNKQRNILTKHCNIKNETSVIIYIDLIPSKHPLFSYT